jgi:hypothetical protein
VRKVSENVTIVARAEGGAGGGGSEAAMKAKEQVAACTSSSSRSASRSSPLSTHTGNNAVSEDFTIAIAVAFLVFLLAVAPLAANYLANSRSSGGFFLRSKVVVDPSCSSDVVKVDLSQTSSTSTEEKKQGLKDSATVTIFDRPPLLRITPSTAFFAHSRTLYNRFFLPTSFLFSLTWGQVAVALVYEVIFVFCLFFQAGDMKENWKRPGAVCVAQVPVRSLLFDLGKREIDEFSSTDPLHSGDKEQLVDAAHR